MSINNSVSSGVKRWEGMMLLQMILWTFECDNQAFPETCHGHLSSTNRSQSTGKQSDEGLKTYAEWCYWKSTVFCLPRYCLSLTNVRKNTNHKNTTAISVVQKLLSVCFKYIRLIKFGFRWISHMYTRCTNHFHPHLSVFPVNLPSSPQTSLSYLFIRFDPLRLIRTTCVPMNLELIFRAWWAQQRTQLHTVIPALPCLPQNPLRANSSEVKDHCQQLPFSRLVGSPCLVWSLCK